MHPSKDLYRRLVVRRGLVIAVHLGARPPQHPDDHRPQRPEVTIPEGGAFLARVSAAKNERFRELLAEALNDGELLYLQEPVATLQVVKEWAQQAANLIQVGYGTGEARLFFGDWDLRPQEVSGNEPAGRPWLERRLMRLSRLMDRMHLMQVGPATKLPTWTYVSTTDVASSGEESVYVWHS